MKSNLKTSIIIASVFVVTGCVTVSEPIHAYNGNLLPESAIAKLTATDIPRKTFHVLEQSLFCGIDGEKFEKPTKELYLLPGSHTICTRYKQGPSSLVGVMASEYKAAKWDEILEVNVAAGQQYNLVMEVEAGGILIKDVHYSLEDMQGKVISSTKN